MSRAGLERRRDGIRYGRGRIGNCTPAGNFCGVARCLTRCPQNSSTESAAMHTTGHRRLANSSLLRLDLEGGKYVGRLYAPDLTVKKVFSAASIDEVNQQMLQWI
jgi:hypothetical protein